MPNDISQADPEEQIIPEEEVQEPTADDASTQDEPQKEKALTAEEYRQIAREEAMRVAQSQVAKSENRTNQRIQERFAALEMNKGTLKLSEEQLLTAQQEIIAEETMNAYKPQPNGQQASSPQGPQSSEDMIRQQIDALNNNMAAIFETVGAEVTPNDPEYKLIDQALKDPKGSLTKTLLVTGKAAEAKLSRILAHKETAKARVSGGGNNSSNPNDISSITDSEQLYTIGDARIRSKK